MSTSESVQLEGTSPQELGLVIEAAEREIDAMSDLGMEGTDQYLEAYRAVKTAYDEADTN